MEQNLELRMYGLVPYNISPIQQGIQFGHSKDEMTRSVIDSILNDGPVDELFVDWLRNWKTYIILNGGTTNNSYDENKRGGLQLILDELECENIPHETFYEPDLNDALTAVCFIADERSFKYNEYPTLLHYCQSKYPYNVSLFYSDGEQHITNGMREEYKKEYGEHTHQIREIIEGKPLAI